MKKETRERTIRETVFIAKDGKIFFSETECREYENAVRLKNMRKNQLKEIKTCVRAGGNIPFDGRKDNEWLSTHKYFWYYPKDVKEVEILNDYFELGINAADMIELSEEWICIDVGNGYNRYSVLDDSIEYALTLLQKLGHIVTVDENGKITIEKRS